MTWTPTFLVKKKQPRVTTPMMEEAAMRTEQVHLGIGGGLMVWTGRSRIGKSTTAEWLVEQYNEHYSPELDGAFRAVHFTTGAVGGSHTTERERELVHKRTLRQVYHRLVGPMDEGAYRASSAPDIAVRTLAALRRENRQLVFIDEAGKLSPAAIEGLTVLTDLAASKGHDWPLTVVLIGMDDLPSKVQVFQQVMNRVHDMVVFKELDREAIRKFLCEFDPYFKALTQPSREHEKLLDFLLSATEGRPGKLVPLVSQAAKMAELKGVPMSATLVRAVHKMKSDDRHRAMKEEQQGYAGAAAAVDAVGDSTSDDAKKGAKGAAALAGGQ